MPGFDPIRVTRANRTLRSPEVGKVALLIAGAILFLVILSGAVALLQRITSIGVVSLPDFAAIENVETRKEAFFEFLLPFIHASNDAVIRDRARIERIAARIEGGGSIGTHDRRWLEAIAADYALEFEEEPDAEALRRLLMRVDIVPADLALAQAALESGWGTSRFAREGNNLFGMWCYEPGCGIVPRRRPPGATYEVARYASPLGSFEAYIRNLNTNRAYLPMRQIRRQLRENGEEITGRALAGGLTMYSEQREEYVRKLRAMIRANQLDRFNRFEQTS